MSRNDQALYNTNHASGILSYFLSWSAGAFYASVVGHFKMRLILTILVFKTIFAFGQTSNDRVACSVQLDTLTKQQVYKTVDKMPEVQGGLEALSKEISRIKFPAAARDQGNIKIYVAFIVKEDGQIIGKRVVRNIDVTDSVERILEILDHLKWHPGMCNGKKVATLFLLPVIIDLAR